MGVSSEKPAVLRLPSRREAPPRTRVGKFFLGARRVDEEEETGKTYAWPKVLWLTGVDYFSTLGYQPGIALLAAGALSVPATAILILVTLFAAVPVYSEVAARSYVGQGSIALLENLLSGWKSKLFVLILLGFAATDFVITMTLSAADAARHAIANPFLHRAAGDSPVLLALGLLCLLAVVFFLGFSEAIGLAQLVAIPYLLLNVVVLVRGAWEIANHAELLLHWKLRLSGQSDWTATFLISALLFPKLALGLSGFETGVSVMPLIHNDGTSEGGAPKGRIRATRYLLLSSALIMSVMLLLSSIVTSLLIPKEEYRVGGAAAGRAIAYLAHHLLGNAFGTLYDFSTILILWFAGASAMAGLLNLIPRYLPRFGMAPRWVAYRRPLVVVLLGINVVITLVFQASVEAQGGAYATGVLVLMLSAGVAVTIAHVKECSWRRPKNVVLAAYFFVVSAVFLYTLGDNVIERPDGIFIASTFIFLLLLVSAISRSARATEMRISAVEFEDEESSVLWQEIAGKKVSLVPHYALDAADVDLLEKRVREHYVVHEPLAFMRVYLQDNRSEFLATLRARVRRDGDRFVIEVRGAVAVANAIAYLTELLDPISIFLSLTEKNLMRQSVSYLLWGEGETALMAYTILVRYWEWTKRATKRPRIFLMSN